MNVSTFVSAVLALVPAEPTAPQWWEIAKGVLLFAITGLLAFVARDFRWMRDLVRDHDQAIYGKEGQNGLKRGLKDVNVRVDVISGRVGEIDDRFVAMDAVAEAEQADYRGPERRHAALHKIVEMVAEEVRREKRGE